MDKVNFLIVDDEALLREGLKSLLQHEYFVKNIYEASSKDEVLQQLAQHQVEIILLDIHLGKVSGLELLGVLKKMPSSPKVIVVTGLEGIELIINLLKEGVSSITFKLDGYAEILKGIKSVLEGGTYFPERITQIIRKNSHRWDQIPPVILTDREKDLLSALARGLTTKEVAEELKMSEGTAETYRLRLIKKTGAHNTAGLLAFAFNNGIL
jgi:DNA-binding NarL/FixJ family response regulator